jgi:hypothetical protein
MSKSAGSSGGSKPKGKPRGKPFEPGQSGNPSGLSRDMRDRRLRVAEALDKRLVQALDDGKGGKTEPVDLLVEAIALGVMEREPSIMRIACDYRWGKPPQEITGEGGGPIPLEIQNLTDKELVARARDVLAAAEEASKR